MKFPIRVLCVFSTLDRGGAESICMNLYRNIDRNKVQFDFVKHTSDKGAFTEEILSLGGRIYEAPHFSLLNLISYRKWWRNHFLAHPEHKIIHGHFFTISPFYFMVAKRMKRVTVGHIHAYSTKSRLRAIIYKLISPVTDYPLACSKQAGQWIYGNRSFTVLKNGVDSSAFQYSQEIRDKMRKMLNLGDAYVIGTVANLTEIKNPMGLIDIFIAFRKLSPNTLLVWVGEGNQRPIIEERIKQEHIEDCVRLLGARDDVPFILQAIDIFLLPSFSEGFPLSVVEAQAAGLPCYISDQITREVDITGLCNFLPIDQPDLWAQKIIQNKKILARNNMQDTIKRAGYDIHTTAKWLEEFYLNIEKT